MLTRIVNGESLPSEHLLDLFFNAFAPALNAGLLQTEYNSLKEMRIAIKAGKINLPNFIDGLATGLDTLYKESINEAPETPFERSAKYGVEIPIDVVTKIQYIYSTAVATQKTDGQNQETSYVSTPQDITIKLNANIKNTKGDEWDVNYVIDKIIDTMRSKQRITIRLGKKIYENCIIKSFKPTITNLYDFAFVAEIIHQPPKQEKTAFNSQTCHPSIRNAMQEEVYKGIMFPNNA